MAGAVDIQARNPGGRGAYILGTMDANGTTYGNVTAGTEGAGGRMAS